MGGGMWGLIATPLFMDSGIIDWSEMGLETLKWNVVGMFSIILWVGGVSALMFGALKLLNILRVSQETEYTGKNTEYIFLTLLVIHFRYVLTFLLVVSTLHDTMI